MHTKRGNMSNNLKCICPRCKFSYTIPLDKDLVRTLPMNKLYWGVYIRTIADHLGYFPEEFHQEAKLMFNPQDSKLTPGARIGGSTTRMTRKEFSEYLEKIKLWASIEHGINLPEAE